VVESADGTDRSSSRTGKPPPPPAPPLEGSHEDEKTDGPNGKVKEPDLRRLFRSLAADTAFDDATDDECRKFGRVSAALAKLPRIWVGSSNNSTDPGVLARLLEACANLCAASCTFEGRVPALGLLKPGG
jgi:hypothetical protein